MAVFLCPGCLPSLPANPPSWLCVKPPCPVAQYPPSRAGNCIPSLAPLVPLHWHSQHSPVGPSSLATPLAPLSLSIHHKRKPHCPPFLPRSLSLSRSLPSLVLFSISSSALAPFLLVSPLNLSLSPPFLYYLPFLSAAPSSFSKSSLSHRLSFHLLHPPSISHLSPPALHISLERLMQGPHPW